MTRTLTVAEAADILQAPHHYVYDRIADGSLPVVDLSTGRRPKWRITAEGLERFVQARTTTEPKETRS